MKSFRFISLVLLSMLSINLFAGSVVIRNGATDVSNSTVEMTQIENVGDAASALTLTVFATDMGTITLSQTGDDVISAVLSGANLYLTFSPTDTAGIYRKHILISGNDIDDNLVETTIDIEAKCLWGKANYVAVPRDVVVGAQTTYDIIVNQTCLNPIVTMELGALIGGCSGTPYPPMGQTHDLTNAQKQKEMMNNVREVAANLHIDNVPYMGAIGAKLTLTDDHGNQFIACREAIPGQIVTAAQPEAAQGFNLSSCFNPMTGATMMDSLYLLTNSYCAVLAPNDAHNGYVFASSFRPDSARRIIRNAGSKKLYFTGRCKTAYTGEKDRTNHEIFTAGGINDHFYNFDGLFNIHGASTDTTHIYMENLEIETKSRAGGLMDGSMSFMDTEIPGASNVFAVVSRVRGNNQYYNVRFHSKGTNELKSNPGVTFYLDFMTYADVISDGFVVGSAPIAIRNASLLDSENNPQKYNARLIFDDYWADGSSTNGFLALSNNGQTNVGAIDLGNKFGRCEFYGGRYKLSQAATRRPSIVSLDPAPQYERYRMSLDYFMSNSLAINYRLFQIQLSVVAAGLTVNVAMYGFGNDMANDGQVTFYGGTFETYGVSDEYMNDPWDYCYFRNKHDLRVPKTSIVNGGTFNGCDVYLCDTVSSMGLSPINNHGDTLCKLSIDQASSRLDGTAIFEIPSQFRYVDKGVATPLDESYGVDGVINRIPKHGINADASGKVNIYVPCNMDEELEPVARIKNKIWWTNVFPQYSANASGLTTANSGRDTVYNCYFVDVNLDTLVYKKGHSYQSVYFNTYRGTLTNTENTYIERKLYIVMPVVTNRWYNFVAPFDISNIYEVNTTTPPATPTASSWRTYRNNLRDNNYSLILGFAPQLIFGAHMDMVEMVQAVADTLFIEKGKDFSINTLVPYNGTNSSTANFYLYYPQDTTTTKELGEGIWKTSGSNEFEYGWRFVEPFNKDYTDIEDNTTTTHQVLMEAKHVYGFSFPGRQRYPYWNGRYLIFEGYGPQIVYGSDEQANFVKSTTTGKGKWGGNYTFKDYAATANMYVLDTCAGSSTIGYYVPATEPITSHTAYMIVNRAGGVGEHVTGMDEGDDISVMPTIDQVSFVAYQLEDLVIEAYKPQKIDVFNALGQSLFSQSLTKGQIITLNVPKGVYVVSGETDQVKISIR